MKSKKLILAADEFYKDPEFAICGVAILDSQMSIFNRRWNALRLEMRKQLLKDAPRLHNHKKLQDEQLPEIHAVDMVQSEGYFRLLPDDPGYRKAYWNRQLRWLEQAASLVSSQSPRIFLLPGRISLEEINGNKQEAIAAYTETLGKAVEKRKAKLFGHLVSSPYHRHLPHFLLGVDDYLAEVGYEAEIIFDEFDYSKGFHEADVLDLLRQSRKLKSNFVSRTDSSETHNILQAADVVSYIASRDRFNNFGSDKKLGDFFNRVAKRHIYPHSISHQRPMVVDDVGALLLLSAVVFEPCKARHLDGRTLNDVFDQLLARERAGKAYRNLKTLLDGTQK